MSERKIRHSDGRATNQPFERGYNAHHPANDHYFAQAPRQNHYTDYPQAPYTEYHSDQYRDQHSDHYSEQQQPDHYQQHHGDHNTDGHANYAHSENYIEPTFSEPDFRAYGEALPRENMHTEEVWIKESQNRISYSDADLRDVTKPHLSNMRTTITGFAGVVAMLGLIGFLAISSVPDLSPEEIIAMQGYAGEQPIKTPFNLASLRNCNNANDCNDSSSNTITAATTSAAMPTATTSAAALPTAELLNAQTTPVSNSMQYIEITEIPTATSMFTGASDSYESVGNTYDTQQATPDLRVTQQWSNVRSQPNADSEILTSLAIGARVTMLSQRDSWYEVFVDNTEQTIGYMHRSTVEPR